MPIPLASALRCPSCGGKVDAESLGCSGCGVVYERIDGTPALLCEQAAMTAVHPIPAAPSRLRRLLKRPESRVWSAASRRAIRRTLDEAGADDRDRLVVNIGAGFERAFQDAYAGRPAVVRVGLPHTGRVDLFGDITNFPVADAAVDALLSSSIMEHVADPEAGVSEMGRVVRPGGLVYAEIPFLRGYHMAPHDYQRYTISGIEQLFARHGFELVEKGVCSGPFTALALFFVDLAAGLVAGRSLPLRALAAGVEWLVHPLKHLDRLLEGSRAAEFTACNFYYLGRRVAD